MLEFGPSSAVWCLATIQVVGLASAWLTRIGETSRHASSCQWLFFACLGLVGLATIAAILCGPVFCIATGATFAVMVLAATWDFSGGRVWAPRR